MTAQKFLADIDAGLTRIEASLKDLRDELYATQLGELQGDLVYLIGLRRMIADGDRISKRSSSLNSKRSS